MTGGIIMQTNLGSFYSLGAFLAVAVAIVALVAVVGLCNYLSSRAEKRRRKYTWEQGQVRRPGLGVELVVEKSHTEGDVRVIDKATLTGVSGVDLPTRGTVKPATFCALCGKLVEYGQRTVSGGLVHEDCYNESMARKAADRG